MHLMVLAVHRIVLMTAAPLVPTPNPKRLARYALAFPAAILAWVLWQLLMTRLFYGGVFQGGLSRVEATAEAVFVLVVAFIAPGCKRALAVVGLVFFICRDIATIRFAPAAGTAADAVAAIGMALLATAVVWWLTRTRGGEAAARRIQQ